MGAPIDKWLALAYGRDQITCLSDLGRLADFVGQVTRKEEQCPNAGSLKAYISTLSYFSSLK
jgi:hypothetical protein